MSTVQQRERVISFHIIFTGNAHRVVRDKYVPNDYQYNGHMTESHVQGSLQRMYLALGEWVYH
jgi:hypothetical protein